MPNFPNDPASRFLDYYGRYLIAKKEKESEKMCLWAVACRAELRKMGDPAKDFKPYWTDYHSGQLDGLAYALGVELEAQDSEGFVQEGGRQAKKKR